MKDIAASIGILTYNSEAHLERALRSVAAFKDIIIADGGSTDRTLEIAGRYGARIISQTNPGHPIDDFARERNLLLEAATESWFCYLDSDEIMSAELAEHIRRVSSDPDHPYDAYRVRYLKTNADGTKPYRTYREYYQVRLVRTGLGARFIRPIHERLELPPQARIGQTEAPWYVTLDRDYLSLPVFARKAWKRTGQTAEGWRPRSLREAAFKIAIEPGVLIIKSFYKMIAVKLRYGRQAIPLRYELLRVLYSAFLSIQFARQLFRARSAQQ
jgi:glycosyltransferase involved in cell wall biosynthesis